MDLREFTNRLALGELRNTTVPMQDNPSEVKEEHRAALVNHTNLGLVALHSKFILREREVLLRTRVPVTQYFLRKEFARTSDADVPYKYIDDTESNPFIENVVSILTVRNQNGEEVYVDDEEQLESIFTVQYDCLQIPWTHLGNMFSVIYQCKHDVIVGSDPCQEIRLPVFLEEALQYYVASKFLSNMNGQEHSAKGQEYMAQYNAICYDVEVKDLARTSKIRTNTKLHKRGFV